jgi:putative transcriptional regulator
MSPTHHPTEDILAAYAAGATSEPMSLILATHMALCPDCRRLVDDFESVGGLLLESMPEEPVELAAFDPTAHEPRTLPRIDLPASLQATTTRGRDMAIPEPLRSYLGAGLDSLRWRRLGGISTAPLLPPNGGFVTQMLRIRAGASTPRHSHGGNEFTLVLSGGYSDGHQHYSRGDFAIADPTIDHRPVADAGQDCLCLAITDAPLKLKGIGGRIASLFIR